MRLGTQMKYNIGDKVKVKEQDIIGEVVAVYDDTEVILCEIDGESPIDSSLI